MNAVLGSDKSEQLSIERRHKVALVRLGGNYLSRSKLEEFARALDELNTDTALEGVIIFGATDSVFSLGMDVHELSSLRRQDEITSLTTLAQSVTQKIASFRCPTVAAISGACLGAAFEFSLACRARVATGSALVGFPELRLGLIPCAGATKHLVNLVGLRSALRLLLSGRLITGEQARSMGIIDVLVAARGTPLEVAALDVLSALPRRSPRERFFTATWLGRMVATRLLSEQRPAGRAVIELAATYARGEDTRALENERWHFGQRLLSAESQALAHIYTVSERATAIGKTMLARVTNHEIGIVGGGFVGSFLAGEFLRAGHKVVVVDTAAETRDSLKTRLGTGHQDKLEVSEDLKAIAECDLVVEATTEDLERKRAVLAAVLSNVKPSAVVATNTSAFSLRELFGASKNPHLIGFHALPGRGVVEVVRADNTSDKVLLLGAAYATRLQRYALIVEDGAGFLINRLAAAYFREALNALADGYSSEDIDRGARSFGMEVGPCQRMDDLGIDAAALLLESLAPQVGERGRVSLSLRPLVERGHAGRKTLRGFYRYENRQAESDPESRALLGLPTETKNGAGDVADRLLYALLNEAVFCLDEGVAGRPGPEAAGQIDLASVMGCGFPSARGGILFWANALGAKTVLSKLQGLEHLYGARFKPAARLAQRSGEVGGSSML